jgi:hypothetical protein
MRRWRRVTGVFFRPGFLARRFLAEGFLAGGFLARCFLWAGAVLVGWSEVVAGAVLGPWRKPGVGVGAGMIGAFTGVEFGFLVVVRFEFGFLVLVVAGLEFGFLVVLRFQRGLLVEVPLAGEIALVKVAIFRARSFRPVVETSFEVNRSVVAAVGGFADCCRIADRFFWRIFLGTPASAVRCSRFVHVVSRFQRGSPSFTLPILNDTSFSIVAARV